MSFTPQDDTGEVEEANSYITVEWFLAYHADRGNTVPTSTPTQQQQALVRGTDYTDGRFSYIGEKLTGVEQVTEWPRLNAQHASGRMVYGIPTAVKEATAEYALRSLSSPLNPDPGSSKTARVKSISQEVGGLKKATTYVDRGSTLPEYPVADLKLTKAGLVRSVLTGTTRRA